MENLERLPDDTVFVIFEFLQHRDLVRVCCVSKDNWEISKIARSDRIWETIYNDFRSKTESIWNEITPKNIKKHDEMKEYYHKYRMIKVAFDTRPIYRDVKIVFVGDGAVGKTSLLVQYCLKKFNPRFIPTIFDNKIVKVRYNNRTVGLNLWDTAGQDDYDPLRPLSYTEADVFVLCYDIMNSTSFKNLRLKWFDEVIQYVDTCKLIICGTKSDLKDDPDTLRRLEERRKKVVTFKEALELQEIFNSTKPQYSRSKHSHHCYGCIETSSRLRKNVDELFHMCLDSFYKKEEKKKKKKKKGRGGCFVM